MNKYKINENNFPILIDILDSLNISFKDFEDLIVYKYGYYGVDYYMDRMMESLKQDEEIFYSDFETILYELNEEQVFKNIVTKVKLFEYEANDLVLQRFKEIPIEIDELKANLTALREDSSLFRELKSQINYLEQELLDKRNVISSRQDNYYEFLDYLKKSKKSQINIIDSIKKNFFQIDFLNIHNASSFNVVLYFKKDNEDITISSNPKYTCKFATEKTASNFFKTVQNKIYSFDKLLSTNNILNKDDIIKNCKFELNILFEQGISSQKSINKNKKNHLKTKYRTIC